MSSSEELQQSISRLKPLADAVVDAATALNTAIASAAAEGLSVRIVVVPDANATDDDDGVPSVRVRVSRQIA